MVKGFIAMIRGTSLLNLITPIAVMLSSQSSSGQALNTLSQEEAAAGWKLLFNGTSNEGWVRPSELAGQFTIEENALGSALEDICTVDEYQDFEFVTDYKYGASANSGIFIRTRKGASIPYRSGIEVAIQDNGRSGNLYKEGDAAIYGIKAPSEDKWTGPGQWNTMRVRVSGTRIENYHNGEKVIDLDMASSEWETLVKASKFSDGTWPDWGKESKGRLCLQYHGHKVLFRNIKILPLISGSTINPKATTIGFHFDIRGSGSDLRLAVTLPGTGDYEVQLLDLSGKMLRVLRGRGGIATRNEMSLRGLPKGLYWLRVMGQDFAVDRRITLF